MKGGKTPLGYTIVEVMIVLAVSGVMFVIAANFINGKQAHTAFNEGANDLVSSLQNVIQDVTDGHYSDVPISCTAADPTNPGTSITPLAGVAGPSVQGTNSQCVFLGKLVHFYGPPSTRATHINIFSLAAARNITGSLPQPGVAAIPTLTTQANISQGLFVAGMHVYDAAGNDHTAPYSIGFVQGLGDLDQSRVGVYRSGAQSVGLVYATTLNGSTAGSEGNVVGGAVQPARSAIICLSDGNRFAQLLVGGAITGGNANSNNSNQLSVSLRQSGTTRPVIC